MRRSCRCRSSTPRSRSRSRSVRRNRVPSPRRAPQPQLQSGEWSGYLAASAYHDSHEIEYNAIREAAALLDVSPLYKYLVSGPDSTRLVDRVITRDAANFAVGRVYYTSWCNEQGRVVDDGTVACLDERTYRWTAADPSLRWLRMNASGLDVEIEDVSERISAVAIQGPLSRDVLEAATETSWGDLAYFGRRASRVGRLAVDVSRTGYTGDLGYEVWVESSEAVELWDALVEAGRAYGLRPAGMLALDVRRAAIEAGVIVIEVDFDSVRRALIPEQSFSPFELGILGRLVDFEKQAEFVGRLRARTGTEARRRASRRLVGLELEWDSLEGLYRDKGLMPTLDPAASREPLPLYARGRQVGKATSTTWSPILKKVVALASVSADHSALATRIEFEWTVEARRPGRPRGWSSCRSSTRAARPRSPVHQPRSESVFAPRLIERKRHDDLLPLDLASLSKAEALVKVARRVLAGVEAELHLSGTIRTSLFDEQLQRAEAVLCPGAAHRS